ncbi:MAG: MFS transporter [Lachnospiraceae bacterium]|nr:MFS transporter [Lachnospiraceae bacterium]
MTRSKKIRIIIAIICISFIQGLQHSVTPILGSIQNAHPDVKVSLIQMLVSGPGLAAMVMALVSGVLVTKISKKKLLLMAAALAFIVGFLPMLSDSFMLLFVCRLVYGLSLGLAMCLNSAVVADFFEGDERVQVMGIQAASVGAGMMIISAAAGALGAANYKTAYWINLIALICFILLLVCLPDTGKVKTDKNNRITLNKEVWVLSVIGLFFFMFLIAFTTNISMHLSGRIAGNTRLTGLLTAAFSLIQIVAGFILGAFTKICRKLTMSAALLSFAIGALLLVLFPGSFPWLFAGALFCGFCQGVMMPTGMVKVTNAVNPVSAAMASAMFSCAVSLGSFISPVVMNGASKLIFHDETTGHVFLLAGAGMLILSVLTGLWNCRSQAE